jgi:hypothetical protein|tara:strand:- start:1116 stop:3581 length:2466 start_codon:yes stop_codon:yes gene_type:complete
MATVDKAITIDEQVDLKVRDRSKGMDIEVDIQEEQPELDAFEQLDDGTLVFGAVTPPLEDTDFYANLAETMDDQDLASIKNDLMGNVEADKDSRREWEKTYRDGLEYLGMKYEERSQPFEGASGVMHPLLAESVTQFQAQAYNEVLPSQGPVKTQVIGMSTPEIDQQASRVQEFMNYQLMQVMKEYDPETDQMLFYLPLSGSAFRKVYYDQTVGRAVSKFIPSEDLIVPYGSTDLHSASRITHLVNMSMNDIRKLQQVGFYKNIKLNYGSVDQNDQNEVQEEIDDIQGIKPSYSDDETCQVYEIHTDCVIPGYEDLDANGEETGIKLPYIVTIANDKVLSIRKNYKENDALKQRINYFVHYKFLPGLGFYGFGLTHMIGGLSKASTSILRQLIDAGTLSNLPAGFKARGIRIRNDDQPLQPGEFRDMDAPGGSLRDAFVPLPFKEPSQTLLSLLGILVDSGRRFASIADLQVGDANTNAPVGTTVALLERGTRVMSAIHKRLHASQRIEFTLLAKVFSEYLPENYPYLTTNGNQIIKSMDFDERVDVLPVSDPNTFSMSQRVMMAQELLTTVQSNPEIHGPDGIYEAYRRMYSSMGVQNIEQLLPPPPQPQPVDPANENAGLISGTVQQAFAGQDHDAHINSHLSLYGTVTAQTNPVVLSLIQAHVYQHISLRAAEIVDQQNAQNPEFQEMLQQINQLPPEVSMGYQQQLQETVARDVAAVVAQLMEQINSVFMPPPPMPDPLVELRGKELDIKADDVQRKREEFSQRQQFDAMKAMQGNEIAEQRLQIQKEIAMMKDEIARERIEQQNQFKAMDIMRGNK